MAEWPEPGASTVASIDGPSGKLECKAEVPGETSRGLMLICHPHPQFGGTMDNKVVYSLARSAIATGFTALRFNFRGVGQSDGSFADGIGELADAAAVLSWGRQHQTGSIVLAGFSFGAAIALRLAQQVDTDRIVSIAPPLRYFDNETLPQPQCPWLVVHGDEDDVVDCDETLSRLQTLSAKPQIEVMPGAGHFFHGRLTELRQIVESFLA